MTSLTPNRDLVEAALAEAEAEYGDALRPWRNRIGFTIATGIQRAFADARDAGRSDSEVAEEIPTFAWACVAYMLGAVGVKRDDALIEQILHVAADPAFRPVRRGAVPVARPATRSGRA